jgi:hypothetical protein
MLSGFAHNIGKYLLAAATFVVLCLFFYAQVRYLRIENLSGALVPVPETPSIPDALIFIFKGIEVYVPSDSEPFKVPIFWMILQILLALLVATYPTNDLYNFATNTLLRAKSRSMWWLAKCAWTTLTVCTFYILCLLVVLVSSLLTGTASLMPNYLINLLINGTDTSLISYGSLVLALLVPLFVSIALSLVQVLLSFIIKPILSFIIIMAYLLVSTYFFSPLLVGDYSMFLRNALVNPSGLSSSLMIAISTAIAVVAILVGAIRLNRMSILGK